MTKNISWITCIECVGNWELVVEYNLTLLNKFSWNNLLLLLLLLFCCFFFPLTLKLNTWRDQFEWTCYHVQNKLDNLLESFAKVFHTIPSKSCKRGDFFGWKKHILQCKKKILNLMIHSLLTFHVYTNVCNVMNNLLQKCLNNEGFENCWQCYVLVHCSQVTTHPKSTDYKPSSGRLLYCIGVSRAIGPSVN